MTSLIPSNILPDIEAREAREFATAAPKTAAKLATAEQKLADAAAALESQKAAAQAAVVAIRNDLENLERLKSRLGTLIALRDGDTLPLANFLLENYLQGLERNNQYRMTQAQVTASELAMHAALQPALPSAIKKCEAEIAALEAGIKSTADSHGIDLAALRK